MIGFVYFFILKVEVWLNRVMDAMRSTVKHELSEAVVAYEEKPRDQWLFDYPAQVALCGTQIWWTTEVVLAFGRLEEGYENALKDYYKKQVLICVKILFCCFWSICRVKRMAVKVSGFIITLSRNVIKDILERRAYLLLGHSITTFCTSN